MNLLFKRSQKVNLFRRVVFKLWGKLEFDDEERALIKHYRFDRALLIEVDQPYLFRNAVFAGLLGALAFGWVLFRTPQLNVYVLNFIEYLWKIEFLNAYDTAYWASLAGIAAIFGMVFGFGFYHQRRETIYVRDLIHGRYFSCESVIELARKEAWLEAICAFLRQVMESAKHWHEDIHTPIEALPKEEARQFIIKGI